LCVLGEVANSPRVASLALVTLAACEARVE